MNASKGDDYVIAFFADVNAILAASSSLKFDDEVSDDNDEQQRSSPDILKEIEANEVRDDESSSSWDSEVSRA